MHTNMCYQYAKKVWRVIQMTTHPNYTNVWFVCITWTNKMNYFLLTYFNSKLLHVLSRLAAHHQEDEISINSNFYSHALCWLAARRIDPVPTTCPYPEPARSCPYPHIPLPEDPSILPAASQHNGRLYKFLLILLMMSSKPAQNM